MAQSAISVRCAGNASKDTLVRLAITHPRAGELAVTLVAPDGRQYPLLGPDPASVSADVITLVKVDASASPRTGTWRLVIVDTVAGNAGTLVSWYLRP
jgi:subtilisin-like proprotein convertase family protein